MSDAQYESLDAKALGLPTGARMPIVFRPAQRWSPLVISFPHVGLSWPPELRPKPQVGFARNADFEVQALYQAAPSLGAATVQAVFSRLVVDLNRAPDDVSPALCPDHPSPAPRRRPGVPMSDSDADHGHRLDRPGRGVVWGSAIGDDAGSSVRIVDRPLPYGAFRDRIDRYHAPYYEALRVLLERRRERFGYAVLLDAHSMPASVGVDLVVGSLDGSSCRPEIVEAALDALRGGGGDRPLRVRVDDPYRGGELVRHFGRPGDGLHALQLEVSRGLYMDERTTTLWSAPAADGHNDGPQGLHTDPGTDSASNRENDAGLQPPLRWRHVPTSRPSPRQARDLVEVVRRVKSLIGRLTQLREEFAGGYVAEEPTAAQ